MDRQLHPLKAKYFMNHESRFHELQIEILFLVYTSALDSDADDYFKYEKVSFLWKGVLELLFTCFIRGLKLHAEAL